MFSAAGGGKRRKKKKTKQKKWRNALKLRRQGRSSIQHIRIYFKKFFLLFLLLPWLFFLFSLLVVPTHIFFSFPSFVRSFGRFFFVIGMSRSASFQHSFRGHQGRSFFLRVFPFLNSHTTMTWIFRRQIQPMASHLIPRPNDIGLDQISSKFSDAKVQSPIYSVFLVAVAYSNRR